MQSLFEKMGIADQIKAKAKVTTPGVPVATLIRSGEAEIGFQQVSELIHEAGIDFLGPIPADIQNITVFSSGVHAAVEGADRGQGVAEVPHRAGGSSGDQEARPGAGRPSRIGQLEPRAKACRLFGGALLRRREGGRGVDVRQPAQPPPAWTAAPPARPAQAPARRGRPDP